MAKTYNFTGAEERRVRSADGGVEVTVVPEPPAANPAPSEPVNGGRLVLGVSDPVVFGEGFDYLEHDPDFTLIACRIHLSAGPNGTIDPAVDTDVNIGDDLLVTITPAVGYHVATLTIDGVEETPAESWEFVVVSDSHTLAVTFAAD